MDGFILINKEIGETSNNVVQNAKKALKAKKVGHLGTLDPIAEGLLILAVNKATKFSSYFLESDKSYEVKVELGKSTDTDDSSGKIIFESNVELSEKIIRESLFSFIGESEQIPPFFSALKYQGKPLYKYAREGQFIKKPARKILIKEINDYKYSNKAVFGLFVTFYWSGAMVGRFIGSYLTKIFQAGRVLSLFALIAIFLIFLSTISNGLISMWSILAIGLFNSIMFPTIFTLSLNGLGNLKPKGSGLLCTGIVGGAIIPPLYGLLTDFMGFKFSLIVLSLCYLYIANFGRTNSN